jgi:hypothetical protein
MALAGLEGVQNLLNPTTLQSCQAAGTNDTDEVVGVGLQNLIPGAIGGAQSSEGPIGIDIAGVLRQNRRYQFPERIVMGVPTRGAIVLFKRAENGVQMYNIGRRLMTDG